MKEEMSSKKKLLMLGLGLALLAIICLLPPFPSLHTASGKVVPLSHSGKISLAILSFAVLLWFTEAMPFAVTGFISIIFLSVLQVGSFKEIVQVGFGNEIVCFFIGVLIISAAITRSGLGNRLSHLILAHARARSSQVVLGFLIVGALLSMWITDMAVAAMLLPLGVGILKREKLSPGRSNFGKALMIACAWGPIIGGVATPAGCGPNPLAIGFLRDLAGVNINFARWMAIGVPSAALMVPVAWMVLIKFFPPEIKNLSADVHQVKEDLRNLGPLNGREKKTLTIFILTVILWLGSPLLKEISGGRLDFSISQVAIFTAMLAFLPGISILKWKEAESDIDWGGIILVISGLSLGIMIHQTGAARWLAWALLGKIGMVSPIIRIFVIVLLVSLLKVAFSSNTVTGIIIIPLIIALARDLGLNAWLLTAPVAITSSLAFILVTSTPTNVIPYSSGYFSIKDMACAGLVMTLAAAICVTAAIAIAGPLTGAYKF